MQWLVMLANDWRLLQTVGWELLRHGSTPMSPCSQPVSLTKHPSTPESFQNQGTKLSG
jgi:hypothetical protein